MRSEVVGSKSYKDVIRSFIQANTHIKAYRSKMAKAAKCQASFLSHVLHSDAHITLDHAFKLSGFFELDSLEKEYFLSLVSLERSSDPEFQSYLLKKLHSMTNKKIQTDPRTLLMSDETVAAVYFSDWKNAVVHALVCVPGFQTIESISTRLKLSAQEVHQCLIQLTKIGILQEIKIPVSGQRDQRAWKVTKKSVHLPKHSPFEKVYHASWRQKAIQSLDSQKTGDIHFSAVLSLNEEQVKRLHTSLVQVMDDVAKTNSDDRSKHQLVSICLDWFAF